MTPFYLYCWYESGHTDAAIEDKARVLWFLGMLTGEMWKRFVWSVNIYREKYGINQLIIVSTHHNADAA